MAVVNLTEESTSRYAQAGDVRMHYNEAGTGEAVIMVHGGGPGASGWSNYVQNVGPLSERFHVLLVDLPGFGKSDPVVMHELRNRVNATALRDLLDALGIEKANVVGNSMGAASSATFAIMYPERINKLVLMGGASGAGRSLFQPLPLEGIKRLNEAFNDPTMDTFRRMIEVFVYDSSFMTDELLQQRLKATLDHPEHLEARKKSTGGMEDLTPLLHAITAKTLVIWGRDDRFASLDRVLHYLWHIPDAQLHLFSRCGHWVQYEKAEEFSRLVFDFLSH